MKQSQLYVLMSMIFVAPIPVEARSFSGPWAANWFIGIFFMVMHLICLYAESGEK